MAQITETICDQCGARKGETNHWWSVWASKVGFHAYPGTYDKNNSDFPEVRDFPAKDICGDACLMRTFSDFLDRTLYEENKAREDDHYRKDGL